MAVLDVAEAAVFSGSVPQVVEFRIEDVPISVSARDATRIVDALRVEGSPDAISAADKIERAMELHSSTTVLLGIGEEERVLAALAELRESGDFSAARVA